MIKALDAFLDAMRTAGKMDDHGKSRTPQPFPPTPSPSLYCAGTTAGDKFTLVWGIQLVAKHWGSGSCDGVMQLLHNRWMGKARLHIPCLRDLVI